jgi:hypothetical protein
MKGWLVTPGTGTAALGRLRELLQLRERNYRGNVYAASNPCVALAATRAHMPQCH